MNEIKFWFFEFQWTWEFVKTLRISSRSYRWNLDMKIFPKFFYSSQGFLENKICHAMNATLGQLNWEKNLFFSLNFKNATKCTSGMAKLYYAKSGCYKTTSLKRNLAPKIRMHWERALGNLLGVLLHAPR
jgi:hypothetical protein